MSYFTQWELYGKNGSGRPLPLEVVEPLCAQLEELADEYYAAECVGVAEGDELICALMTDYGSAYKKVVDAVTDYSKSFPDAVFQLFYENTDDDIRQRIHIRNGEYEELDGHIAYEPPKKIPYDSSDKPRLYVVLQGGSVQGVFADGALDADVTIVDRDLSKMDGCAPEEACAAVAWMEEKLIQSRAMTALYGAAN